MSKEGHWGPRGWKSYVKDYLFDIMPMPMQVNIVRAAQHPEDSDDAEKWRRQAGYGRDTMRANQP